MVTPPEEFGAWLTSEGRRVRIEIAGELDMDTGDRLLEAARSSLVALADGSRPERVVIDLGRVTFMDSSGLLAVLRCREIVERAGAELRVALSGGPVARLFKVAGVTGWLDYC